MTDTYNCLDGLVRPYVDQSVDIDLHDLKVTGVVEPGHGVASGKNSGAGYPLGTIPAQYPHFLTRGVDMGSYFAGTLNVSIAPATYVIHDPWRRLDHVKWCEERRAENFLLARCCVGNNERTVCGLLYQPDPATKTEHFDDPSHLQIVAPFLPNAGYGSRIDVHLVSCEVGITGAGNQE